MSGPMEARLSEIRALNKARRCPYMGRCNSRRCQLHGEEARAMDDLIEMVETLIAHRDASISVTTLASRSEPQ